MEKMVNLYNLISIREAARISEVSHQTFWNWVAAGLIDSFKVGNCYVMDKDEATALAIKMKAENPQLYSEVKHTPDYWLTTSDFLHILIRDPDGWDRQNLTSDWIIPLTNEEFSKKLFQCTIAQRTIGQPHPSFSSLLDSPDRPT